jgi:anti-sigma regulatory factor (Ser/Thr protein kinase)
MERILLPRDPRTPRRARRYLAPRLSRLGLPPDAAEELLVAVGEAVTNAVLHGSRVADPPRPHVEGPGVTADTVMVELLVHGDRVAVVVTSPSGRWRVPHVECPAPIAVSGRGLYLMRHLADSVRVEQGRRGTTVYLIRRLPHALTG